MWSASVTWETYIAEQQARRIRLVDAAQCLLRGNPAPVLPLLSRWRFASEPALVQVVLDQLREGGFLPEPGQLTAVLGDAEALRRPSGDWWGLPTLQQRDLLAARCGPDVPASVEAILAWAIDELSFFGAEIERRQREIWRDATWTPDPKLDAATAKLWDRWFAQKPWEVREKWEKLFLPVASRAFSAVLEARQIPIHVRQQVREDLQEAFFFSLLGGSEGTPGWQELAVRVIETSGSGPVDAMALCLDGDGWARAGSCAVRRGYGPRSAALVWPDAPNALARGRTLSDQGQSAPDALESYLDVHVAVRLLDTWREPGHTGTERSWRVVLQNRGRASGRLRAVVASAELDRLRAPLFELDNLHARTVSAVGRHCKHWAWQQLSRGFSFDYGRSVSAPCMAPTDELPPFSDHELRELKAWMLLTVIKGRLGHLTRWVATGSTGDRDTQWGRLLSESLPPHLRDPGGGLRGTYDRLRAELSEVMDDKLQELMPIIRQLAALEGRSSAECRQRFTEVLTPIWVDSIPFPQVRYRGFVQNAAETLRWMQTDDTDPR